MRLVVHGGTFREDGRRYLVMLEPELSAARLRDNPAARTITHGPIAADALSFSVSGVVYLAKSDGTRDRRYREGIAYGQISDELRKVKTARAQHVADLWDRWHLNDMRANCAHMPDQTYHAGLTCPETGYQSGSAWLYEPIPAGVLADLRATFGLPL